MFLKVVKVLGLTLFLAACGGNSSDSSGVSESVELQGFNGSWRSNCYLLDDLYVIDTFFVSGKLFSAVSEVFDDPSCSEVLATIPINGSFTAGDALVTDSGLNALEIDFLIEFEGDDFEFLDIIRIDGDTFNFGVLVDFDSRPSELDFEVTFTRI